MSGAARTFAVVHPGVILPTLVTRDSNFDGFALDSYKHALDLIRADSKKYDPTMTNLIAKKYAALLRKTNDVYGAIAIENEFSGKAKASVSGQ